MEKINCDIIRDLIPSYVDEVCSQATKECVEEHINDCGECRLIAAKLREQTLSGEKLEQRGLDGLKKYKKMLNYQNIICYVLLLFVIFLGVLLFLLNRYSNLLFEFPKSLLVCLAAVLAFSAGGKGSVSAGKWEYALSGLSLAIDVYFQVLYSYMVQQLVDGAETIFGMELMKTGPFLEKQLIAAYFLQAGLLFYNFFCIMHRDKNCHWMLCLNLTGIFLLLHYDVWMKYMSDFETLKKALFQTSFTLMGIGAAGIVLCLLITRSVRRKKNAKSF